MRYGVANFQPERLRQARFARGIRMVDLADLIGRSKTSVGRWEKGEQLPEHKPLMELASALNTPENFFLKKIPDYGANKVFYRSNNTATRTAQNKALSRLRWAQEISSDMQNWIELPWTDIPKIRVESAFDIKDRDIEDMADQVRDILDLGRGPIENIILLLENCGIPVIKDYVGSDKMDGISNFMNEDGRYYICLARDKETCCRSRMDAAHELGHIVLHSDIENKEISDNSKFSHIEKQAYRFAGALLMPEERFSKDIGVPTLESLVRLKPRWGVSIGAMITRCYQLGHISYEHYRRLFKQRSYRGWSKQEPYDDPKSTPIEEPKLLARSMKLLIEERVVTKREALEIFSLKANDVENLCNLPNGYFHIEEADVVKMPDFKHAHYGGENSRDGSGKIVPFKAN